MIIHGWIGEKILSTASAHRSMAVAGSKFLTFIRANYRGTPAKWFGDVPE